MTVKRYKNFRNAKREILNEILKDLPIVENRSYKTEFTTDKIKVWHEITKLFNANVPEQVPWDEKVLKGKYYDSHEMMKTFINTVSMISWGYVGRFLEFTDLGRVSHRVLYRDCRVVVDS